MGEMALAWRVGLVGDHDDAPPGPAQHLGDVAVDRGQALADVEQQHDHVGLVDRDARLRLDGRARRVVGGFEVEPRRVDHAELAAAPLRDAVQAVAGETGLRVDDRLALTDQAVEEGRLSDIRATDDRDNGPCHAHRIAEAVALRTKPKPIATAGFAIQSTPATTLEARSPAPLTPFRTPYAVPSFGSSTIEPARELSTDVTTGSWAPSRSASTATPNQPCATAPTTQAAPNSA